MTDVATLTRICSLSDVGEDLPFRAEVGSQAFAVFQVGDEYYVTADECTHGPGLLSDGFVEGCEVECPFHQGRFCLKTGAPTLPPCEIPVKVWTPVVRDDAIFIDIDAPKAA